MLQKSRKLNRHHNSLDCEFKHKIYESEDKHIQFHDLNSGRFVSGDVDQFDYPLYKEIGPRVFRVVSIFEDSCNVEYFHKDEFNVDFEGL